MTSHLFTIGLVLGFIAQARKTRDLKAGSQLLSDLIRHAWEIKMLIVFKIFKLIMPTFPGQDYLTGSWRK
ncbi:MAG: type III-B CRISPR-associated protein Cas10/Cmr2 [Bacteroidia bacterium]